MIAIPQPALFPLGRLVATPGVLEVLDKAGQSAAEFVERHLRGDWGTVCAEDWAANDQALVDGTRLVSAYRTKDNVRIRIITEWDRSYTTIMLPEEY